RFLGDSNFIPGTVRECVDGRCSVETPLGALVAGTPERLEPGSRIVCSIRPHALAVVTSSTAPNSFSARVEQVTYLGEMLQIRARAGGEYMLEIVSLPHLANKVRDGDPITVNVSPEQVVLLPDTK